MRALIFALLPSVLVFAFAAQAQTNNAPTYKMEGMASLMSNYVDYGVSQTTQDPALQAAFWFNWGPQFRMGLWGSNVSYENSESHFRLKLNADLKIQFSENTSMTIKYSDDRYFKSETRNGNILGLHLELFSYGVHYEKISNYLGTENGATAAAFSKTWDVFTTWKWDNRLGYVMMNDSAALKNYFFWETYLGIRPGSIYYQIGTSYNTVADQFNGAAGLSLILKATVTF